VRRPRAARTSAAIVTVAALAATPSAAAGLERAVAQARAAVALARTADGMQLRYDAGRALEDAVYAERRGCVTTLRAALVLAHGLVRWAEGYDRPRPILEGAGRRQAAIGLHRLRRGCGQVRAIGRLTRRPPRLPDLPPLVRAAPPSADSALAARLAAVGRAFPGYAAVWTHDLRTGRAAGWNSDARFPAASTVKLGVILAALRRLRHPERSPLDYDLRAMAGWSSNLAANRLTERFGIAAVEAALRRAGAWRSTYPQGYRVGTARADVVRQPPLVSGRVTTARDLGRLLYVVHAGAVGNRRALAATALGRSRSAYALRLLLASELRGNNVGLVRPFFAPTTPVAQKNGWIRDARHTAAIVYGPSGPRIVVVLTYAPGLQLATARAFARKVVRLR
jgi:beta-lactamase class A